MPQDTQATRDPQTPTQTGGKIALWTTVMSAAATAAIPGIAPLIATAVGSVAAGMMMGFGASVRDHQHTYEEGGKRAGRVQNGALEVVNGMIGKWL